MILWFYLLPSPKQSSGVGMGSGGSGQSITVAPSFSHFFPAPVWVLPKLCSHSWTAPALFLSTRYSPSRNRLLQCESPAGHRSCQKTCSCVDFSPQTTAPARSLLLSGLSMGRSFHQGISFCCTVGSSMGCSVDICSSVVFRGLQGDNLLHQPLLHGLHWNLCSGTWSNFSPHYSLTLVSAGLFCSHLFSFLPLTAAVQCFYLFLHIFSQRCHHLGWGAQLHPAMGPLELTGTICVWHAAAPASPHRGDPASPLHCQQLGMCNLYKDSCFSCGTYCKIIIITIVIITIIIIIVIQSS